MSVSNNKQGRVKNSHADRSFRRTCTWISIKLSSKLMFIVKRYTYIIKTRTGGYTFGVIIVNIQYNIILCVGTNVKSVDIYICVYTVYNSIYNTLKLNNEIRTPTCCCSFFCFISVIKNSKTSKLKSVS